MPANRSTTDAASRPGSKGHPARALKATLGRVPRAWLYIAVPVALAVGFGFGGAAQREPLAQLRQDYDQLNLTHQNAVLSQSDLQEEVAQLTSKAQAADQLTTEVEQLRAGLEQAQSDVLAKDAALAAVNAEMEALRGQVAEVDALRSQLAAAKAPPAPAPAPVTSGTSGSSASGAGGGSAYYKNCAAARAAGVAPLKRGEPGYRAGLDRDNDGVACE